MARICAPTSEAPLRKPSTRRYVLRVDGVNAVQRPGVAQVADRPARLRWRCTRRRARPARARRARPPLEEPYRRRLARARPRPAPRPPFPPPHTPRARDERRDQRTRQPTPPPSARAPPPFIAVSSRATATDVAQHLVVHDVARDAFRVERNADAQRMANARGGDVQLAVREAQIGEPHARALERLPLRHADRHRMRKPDGELAARPDEAERVDTWRDVIHARDKTVRSSRASEPSRLGGDCQNGSQETQCKRHRKQLMAMQFPSSGTSQSARPDPSRRGTRACRRPGWRTR